MFRRILMIVLAVVVLCATPVDAQLFRRFSRVARPTPNYGQTYLRQAMQQPTTQQGRTCQAQQQLVARQQAQVNQGVARIPSTYNNQPNAAQQTAGQQGKTQRTSAEQRANKNPAAQGQRYAVFYNLRTNQTILRPIQALRNRNQNSVADRNSIRQPVRQRNVSPQVLVAPTANRSQVDIARRPSNGVVTRPMSGLTLNAPPRTLVASPPVQPAPQISPAIATPAGSLNSDPIDAVAAQPDVDPESPEPKKAFSILDSGGPDNDK